MRYFKTVKNGYILTVGTGGGGVEISENEYRKLYDVFMNRPKDYRGIYELCTDTLTWEKTGMYPDTEDSVLNETEQKALAYDILMGVME